MAFNEKQEAQLLELLAAYENGKRINELEPTEGLTGSTLVEVMDSNGETRRMELEQAVAEAGNPIAGRWWDESLATTKAGGWFGSLDALRKLPATLGLGRYLVADDRTMRKLDPMDSRRFEDGSPAALDGSMGQCMWCWSRPWYFTYWKEGTRGHYAITLKPLEGRKSYRIPVGGVSWLGAGVMDRTEGKLCSLISEDERYRGGRGVSLGLTNNPRRPDMGSPQVTMLGMAASYKTVTEFGACARKRGEGWEANWFVAHAAVGILLLVIMGERNIQADYIPELDKDGLYQGGFGAGVTGMRDWNSYNAYNPLIPTSVGVEMGDWTGLTAYSLPPSEASADQESPYQTFQVPCFFGLMHAGYGHMTRWIRGMTIRHVGEGNSEVYVAGSMQGDFDPYETEGLLKATNCPQNAGYIVTLSWECLCGVATLTGGSGSTFWADEFFSDAPYGGMGSCAACGTGGTASQGSEAGFFSMVLDTPGATGTNKSTSPLCFFAEDPRIGAVTTNEALPMGTI